MHKQLMNDFLSLRTGDRMRIQRELDITFHQGMEESDKDFAKRVLTAVDNSGKLRQLEALITEVA